MLKSTELLLIPTRLRRTRLKPMLKLKQRKSRIRKMLKIKLLLL
jgi:hypothetical protein